MASGAEDYWMSSSRLMAGLMEDIKSGLLAGSALLNQLDALDGTMDGKLDLSDLNISDVKTNLDTMLTKLDTSITKLTDQLTKLTSIDTSMSKMVAAGYIKVDTSADTIMDITGTSAYHASIKFWAHPANTANITLTLKRDAVTKQSFTVAPGSYRQHHEYTSADYWNIVQVVAASGEQYYKPEMPPYS